ncbi:MAG: inositol monophosphatase [Candidatus Latescibacteria bacterium]|nr:inositol monophosphatase [Candidatus Latescibacterota bacterium]
MSDRSSLDSRLALATQAATEAGRLIVQQTDRRGTLKDDRLREIVTEADRASERLIIDAIRSHFPADAMLGEEFGLQPGSSGYAWVIDPIDGTTNYAHGIPIFVVSIGIVHEGRVVVGVVYDPNRNDTFKAVRGGGAFRNGECLHTRTAPLSTRTLFGFSSRFIGPPPPHVVRVLEDFDEYRNLGSAALHLCAIACGWLDGAFSDSTKLWDIAAGSLLVEEAGGRITRFDGAPVFPLTQTLSEYAVDRLPFLATNGHLDHAALKAIFTGER